MRLSSLSLPQCTPCAWRGSSSRGSWWGRSSSCTDSSRADRGRRAQRSAGRARRGPPVATPTTPADTHRPALDRENSSLALSMINDDLTCDPRLLVAVGDDVHTVGVGDTSPTPHILHHWADLRLWKSSQYSDFCSYIHHHSISYQGLFLAFSVQRKELKSK